MERREPIIEDQTEEVPEPQPETASAGGVRPPGRIGGGLRDDEGSGEDPPRGQSGPPWSDPSIFHMAIEDLNLSMRANNCLRRSGLMTVGQVLERRAEELLALRNFGRKQYEELRERLDELGILEAGALLPGDLLPQAPPEPPNLKELLRRWEESLGD